MTKCCLAAFRKWFWAAVPTALLLDSSGCSDTFDAVLNTIDFSTRIVRVWT